MTMSKLNIPKSEIIRLADEWIWNARNKEILFKKLDGFTYEEIAEEFFLSTVRTKEIVKKSVNIILEHSN